VAICRLQGSTQEPASINRIPIGVAGFAFLFLLLPELESRTKDLISHLEQIGHLTILRPFIIVPAVLSKDEYYAHHL
jgi:hypothetical protein